MSYYSISDEQKICPSACGFNWPLFIIDCNQNFSCSCEIHVWYVREQFSALLDEVPHVSFFFKYFIICMYYNFDMWKIWSNITFKLFKNTQVFYYLLQGGIYDPTQLWVSFFNLVFFNFASFLFPCNLCWVWAKKIRLTY